MSTVLSTPASAQRMSLSPPLSALHRGEGAAASGMSPLVTADAQSLKHPLFSKSPDTLTPEEAWINIVMRSLSLFSGMILDETHALPVYTLWEEHSRTLPVSKTASAFYRMLQTTFACMQKQTALHRSVVFPSHLLTTAATRATSTVVERKELLSGNFGTQCMERCADGTTYVLKTAKTISHTAARTLKKSTSASTLPSRSHQFDDAPVQFAHELKVFLRLPSHRNIIQFYGTIQEGSRNKLVLEYAALGDLFTELSKRLPSVQIAAKIAHGVMCGVEFLHANGIVHRDLKPENTVLDIQYNAKIIDFGLAVQLPLGQTSCTDFKLGGTPEYLPPESVMKKVDNMRMRLPEEGPIPVSTAGDMWSVGALLYDLLGHNLGLFRCMSKQFPQEQVFTSHAQTLYLHLHKSAIPQTVKDSYRHTQVAYDCSDIASRKLVLAMQQIAIECLKLYPQERPSAGELLRKYWVRAVEAPATA